VERPPSAVHPLVRLDFLVRLVGCPLGAFVVASARHREPTTTAIWAVLAFYAFAWPHVAHGLSRRAADGRAFERRMLMLDAAFIGAWIALASFQPAPMLVFVTSQVTILASVGGWSLLGRAMPVMVASTLLVGSLTGFRFENETSWLTTAGAAVTLISFQLLMAIQTWRQARGFIASRRQISEQAEEIRHQNEQLALAREEALQAADAKAAFLATMSHEIRTPLNGVLGMTRLVAETPLTPDQRDYVGTIQTSGQALLAIINDILDYSKIESGRLELEQESLRVTDVVEEALDMVAERARAKGVELLHQVDPEVPATIRGDITRLRQILTNLVGNAVKFTEKGEVLVHVVLRKAAQGDEPAELAFEVHDTGIGIPEDRLSHLFSPFTQVDASTTRRYGGTGLGLAISRRLTEIMGGEVSVSSSLGRGSTFTFTIRALPAPDQVTRQAREAEELAGRRVLVVDDNETNRRVLLAQLTAWGFVARAVDGGNGALALLEAGERFDLAVLDLHMPDMDGIELARRLREAHHDVPLILLSSSQLATDESAALFAARLLKPARQSRLFDAIARSLGASIAAPETIPPRSTRRLGDLTPLRLLVADDNEVNRRLAGLVLRRFGYAADYAENGRQALDKVVEQASSAPGASPYDLVFMDVHMPEMDGLAATRAIRFQQAARPESSWPRIVAMTADALKGDREVCLDAGMDDYLTKPLDFEAVQVVLEREVARRIGRPRPAAPLPAEAPAVPAPAAQARGAEPVLFDRSRLDELREYDTPDGAVVKAALDSFAEQAPGHLERLRSSLASGDAPAVRESAHALKGTASNVGALALAALAAEVEQAGRSGELGAAPGLLDGLAQVLDRTLVEIRQTA
jgi:signal transduction histidine kinase/DNA-binding response OmpR family regulator/HPt (histidine-containing phosphotransfer) domain-containing protein